MPYVPDVFEEKTGLWCNNDDFICGSSVWGKMSGHLRYAEEGDGIDLGVLEAAERVRASLPPEKAQHVDVSRAPGNGGTAGLDVVFLIDTTGSMSGRIRQARVFAASVAEQIASMRGRVALATYRDAGDVYTARVETQFSSDLTGFQSALSTMRASGGGDTHERVVITRNGKPAAVLISPDDLASLEETLEILSDKALMERVAKGKAEIDAGETVELTELRRR